jgi:seryl-tRNA synthetase
MLDVRLVREQPEAVERGLAARGESPAVVKDVLTLDADRRRLVREAEELKAERNRVSEAIGQARRRGQDAAAEQARMRETGERIKALDAEVAARESAIERLLLQLPNLPQPSVPPGLTEDQNVEVRRWGTPRSCAVSAPTKRSASAWGCWISPERPGSPNPDSPCCGPGPPAWSGR